MARLARENSIVSPDFSGDQVLKRHIEYIVHDIAKVDDHLPCPKYKVEPK
jgi:hypothetical protein